MKIGNLEFGGVAAMAPMAGVADRAVRELAIEYGAAFSVSELISAKGVSLNDKKSKSLLFCSDMERPAGCQLFGCEPDVMAEAAVRAVEFSPDFIDINMGCPAPKVAGNGGGCALMKSPELAGKIVRAVADAVKIPVTVKMRTGWDEDNVNAVEVAKRVEDAGASAVTVHGRTRRQMYSGEIDYDTIRAVKNAVKVPVIGNGDIFDGPSARGMMERTGCDMVMVGRAALGAPWIFKSINEYFFDGTVSEEPPLSYRLEVLKREIRLMLEYKDETRAYKEARTHVAWYMRGLNGAASLRRMCGTINSFSDIENICNEAIRLNL